MAGTIRFQSAVQVEHDVFQFQWSSPFTLDQTNRGMAASVHQLSEVPENVSYGEVVSAGLVVLHNIGTTPLRWGVSDGGAFRSVGCLGPGEFALFRLYPGVILQAKADSAAGAILQPYVLSA